MTLKELQKILTSIAPADREAMDRAKKRQAELAKPPGSLGKLEDMSIRLAGITGQVRNQLESCRILVFAADNGVCAEGVSCTPQSVTREQAVNMTRGLTGMSTLARFFGDEVIVTIVEHHSNFLPWLQAAKRHGAALKFLECDAKGEIPLEALEEAITDKTRLVTMTQMSNVFGREYDVKAAAALCHSKGDIVVIADGSQSVPHIKVDVQDLGVDFLAFSGHKMLAPMGIGVLWGKKKWLDAMPPFLFGGEMIQFVSREGAVYAEVPHKFEAGTVNAGGAVGLEAAIHYIEQIGFDRIRQREEYLSTLMLEGIKKIPHVHLLGADTPEQHHGIFSFTVDDVHPHDVSAILADAGIAVRAGHHCAQPLLQHLGVNATTRASLAFYNTEAEVEAFLKTLREVRSQMGYAE